MKSMEFMVIGGWENLERDYRYMKQTYSVWKGIKKVWDQWPEKLNKKN